MHAATREKMYTDSIGVKVTHGVALAIEAAAEADGISQMAWIRAAIEQALRPVPNSRILLAEVLALRAIVLTLQSPQWVGISYTEEQMRDMIRRADEKKFGYVDSAVAMGMER